MQRREPSTSTDLLRLGAALVLLVVGAIGQFSLPLDVANRAMKSTGTPDAEVAARREREFGVDHVVVASIEPRGSSVSGDPSDEGVQEFLETTRALDGVEQVQVLPGTDATGTLVAITLAGDTAATEPVVERIRAGAPVTHRLHVTGQPVGEVAIARALESEQKLVVPAILAILWLALMVVHRRPTLTLATLLPGLGAITAVGGVQHALGLGIDPVSSLLAPVLLTVGVAASVHLVERHLDLIGSGTDPKRAPGTAARMLARPMVLTTATTAAGFLALSTNSIPAVRRFGWFAAFGVAVAMAWALLVVPSLLRLFVRVDRHGDAAHAPARRPGIIASFAVRRMARTITIVTGLLFCFLAFEGTTVSIDTHPERVLPPDHPFRAETDAVAQRLGGIETFEVYVPADERRPDTLAALALAGEIANEPLVRPMPGLPRRSESGSILLTALLHPGGTAERERLFARVEAAAEARGLHGARVTGAAVRVARDSEELVRDQRRSLFAMVLFVWIALAIGFRSIKLAVIGIVPNVVPIAALYGGLALAGRPLSASTAMIGTVFLGLVVDDTIHFLHGYRAARERGLSPRMAVASAYSRSGRAITVTTAVLCLGFGAAVMGRLETTIEFAVVSALVILLAWICDLLVLPALLMLGSPILRSNAPRTRRFSLPWIESTT